VKATANAGCVYIWNDVETSRNLVPTTAKKNSQANFQCHPYIPC
jgi:hypothetical protein